MIKNIKILRSSYIYYFSGRHPKLLHCNVYVTMFYKVLNSFFFFLLWYSLFLIAFGMGFYIMLHDDSLVKDPHGLDKEDKNKYFNRTWTSLVKTSAMFVGELEFSDLPMNTNTYLGMLAYAFFLAFIFLIVVVLMNLLNGLAVSDTNDIKEKAEIYSYISRVETISYMESVLLGDPFDFLTNWPPSTFLARLPAMALCYQVAIILPRNALLMHPHKKKPILIFTRFTSCARVPEELDTRLLAPLGFFSSSGDLKIFFI